MLASIVPPLERAQPAGTVEVMDRPDCDPDDLRRALEGLDRVQRAFGGHEMIARPVLRALAGRRPGPLRLLDVGAGGGDLAAELGRRLRDRGWSPRITLADLHPRTIRIARERWPADERADGRAEERAEGCADGRAEGRAAGEASADEADFVRLHARRLPFPDGTFDLGVSSTMLHHLGREEALAFLREIDRVTDGAWLVADLRRSRVALAAVRLLAATVWRRNPLPRRDGPLSVHRAFTPGELTALLARGGPEGARVDGRWPVRLRILGPRLAERGAG